MTCRWDFTSLHRGEFGVQRICRVPEVSRSGFYRWIAGAKARAGRQAAADALVAEIREIHTQHRETTGVAVSTPNCGASGTPSTASASSTSCACTG
ncbi:hypothetical protein SSP35_47_00030 [Streptomyces sp. NBRC 110611]|uniref:hypothetical protein n=1 Tax=Streptomyces sp. NBRC 110611 TaxID=1621259 RepID=UPI00082B09BD|nr:hypothetical protein [Streptomyces sp. NBRC 110611]GAU71541.1 hypothetical protein SSP35_47_00030 [Streptomyces sp. NBRC 110611]